MTFGYVSTNVKEYTIAIFLPFVVEHKGRGGGMTWSSSYQILHKLKHYPMKLLTLSTKKMMTKYKVDILTFFQNQYMNIKRYYDHLSFLSAFCTRS